MEEMKEEKNLEFELDKNPPETENAEEKPAREEPKKETSKKDSVPKKKVMPRLFFGNNDQIDIIVTGYYNAETGYLEFVIPGEPKKGDDEDSEFIQVKHLFRFSRVPYNRLNIYRTQAMRYNEEDKTNTINVVALRDYLWTFHLKDWNLEDENGEKKALKHDPDGTLSKESQKLLNSLPAILLDTVITLFEQKVNIS